MTLSLSELRRRHWRRRGLIALAILGLAAIGFSFIHNFSYQRALNRAGFDGNNIEWVWESVDLNRNDLVVAFTTQADGTPAIVQMEKSGWRGWHMPVPSFYATPEADGRIRWAWIGDLYQGQHEQAGPPWAPNRWVGSSHLVVSGNDATGPVEMILDHLPHGVNGTVAQTGSAWVLHLIEPAGLSGMANLPEIETELASLGVVAPVNTWSD